MFERLFEGIDAANARSLSKEHTGGRRSIKLRNKNGGKFTVKTLNYGSAGAETEMLQLGLSRSGFYKGKIDGKFGIGTLNATRRFQTSRDLRPDGIAGERTFRALRPFLTGYFISIIRSGDTFYKLAGKYNTTVNAIETANPGLSADNLPIGAKIVIPYGFELIPTDVHYTSELFEMLSEGLKIRYPFIKCEAFGNSVLKRPLYAFRIGNGKKQIFINAAHHANEWITTPLVLKFLEKYLETYSSGGLIYGLDARELFEKTTLFAAPLVNPDGIDLVNGALNENTDYYRKVKCIAAAYPGVPFPDGWKANIEGTDLNLNYPAGWEQAKSIKYSKGWVSPAPRDFVGTEPLCAPEAKAVFDFTVKNDFYMTLSYHTQGKVIYWKYKDAEPPDGQRIGYVLAKASGYTLEEPEYESGNAGYKDWFILKYNRPGYTVEAGKGENPLSLSQFDMMFNDNIGVMASALKETAGL